MGTSFLRVELKRFKSTKFYYTNLSIYGKYYLYTCIKFGKYIKLETFVLYYNTKSPENNSPGIYICLCYACFVQLICLAEDQITHDEQDDQAAHGQVLILEGDAENVHLDACGDLADEGH